MPINVKNYVWKQTDEKVQITVPMKVTSEKSADIAILPQFLKASQPPYIFEVCLSAPIEVSESACTIADKELIFDLVKRTPEDWPVLELDLDKKQKLEFKKKALDESQTESKAARDEKKSQMAELKRIAVREQVALEDRMRQKRADMKEADKLKGLGDIDAWKNNLERPKRTGTKARPETKIHIPNIRESKIMEIEFTTRSFPTPSRQSMRAEEEEWLMNQAKARKATGFVSEDLRPEERNPVWLKDKGDEFTKQGNYLGAITAYSLGIKLSPAFSDLYARRSNAHFAIKNYHKCLEDSSTALDLMKPQVPANLEQRADCIHLRGKALCELGLKQQGIVELEEAVRLMPSKEHFKTVLESVELQ